MQTIHVQAWRELSAAVRGTRRREHLEAVGKMPRGQTVNPAQTAAMDHEVAAMEQRLAQLKATMSAMRTRTERGAEIHLHATEAENNPQYDSPKTSLAHLPLRVIWSGEREFPPTRILVMYQ